MRAPASTAARIWSELAAVCPIATTTPLLAARRMNAGASSNSAAMVNRRMRPPAASWSRWNSSQSGRRQYSRGCAPRGPSSLERYGPSRWMPAMRRAISAEPSQAAAITRSAPWSTSNRSVVSVGQKRVTPKRSIHRITAATSSLVKSAELNSRPPQPLTCRSTNPGAIQGQRCVSSPGASTGVTSAILSPAISNRTAWLVSYRRPNSCMAVLHRHSNRSGQPKKAARGFATTPNTTNKKSGGPTANSGQPRTGFALLVPRVFLARPTVAALWARPTVAALWARPTVAAL